MEITENDNGEIKVNRNIDELEAIERIAFHEAAHAVIEFIFGYSITRVEIDPSEESGCCVYDHKSNVSREIIDLLNISEVDRRVMILCAGFGRRQLLLPVSDNYICRFPSFLFWSFLLSGLRCWAAAVR